METASCRVPWRVQLVNGDTLTGEILSGTPESLELQLFVDSRIRIPFKSVAAMTARNGERLLVDERFDQAERLQVRIETLAGDEAKAIVSNGRLHLPATQPIRLTLPQAQGELRCMLWLKSDGPPDASDPRLQCLFEFADGSEIAAVVEDDAEKWHSLRLHIIGGRYYLSLDDRLIHAGNAGDSPFQSIACRTEPSSMTGWVMDDLSLVVRESREAESPSAQVHLDGVLGTEGEIWWGRFRDITADGVEWTDRETIWHQPWRRIRGIIPRSPQDEIAGRTLCGRIVRLELQPSADRPDLPRDQLTVSLGDNRGNWLLVDHPFIGRMAIPRAAIKRIEHRFAGEWRLLDARETSLSESDFRTGTFVLTNLPTGEVGVSLEATGLEPSGSATPPGSARLMSLRAGEFTTDLFVNDRRVGSFNELVNDWSLPGRFDRLSLPVPRDVLQRGENTWRIVQQPGRNPKLRPPEVRIRNIGLEIAPAVP